MQKKLSSYIYQAPSSASFFVEKLGQQHDHVGGIN
jgi:hypothetical protein